YRLRNQLLYMGNHRLPDGPGSYVIWRWIAREIVTDHQECPLQNIIALLIREPLADRLLHQAMYAKGLVACLPLEHGETGKLGKGFFHVPVLGRHLVSSALLSHLQFHACSQCARDRFGCEPAKQIKQIARSPVELFKA